MFITIKTLAASLFQVSSHQDFFTQPLIVSTFHNSNPKATVLNSLEKALAEDTEFVKRVKVQSLKKIYEYIEDKHIKLISCLGNLPEEYHSLPFYKYFAKKQHCSLEQRSCSNAMASASY